MGVFEVYRVPYKVPIRGSRVLQGSIIGFSYLGYGYCKKLVYIYIEREALIRCKLTLKSKAFEKPE